MSLRTLWRCTWDTMTEALRIRSYVCQTWIVHLFVQTFCIWLVSRVTLILYNHLLVCVGCILFDKITIM
jgi:hypothetical protein